MSAPALAAATPPTLRIRGTHYPVLLPTLRDPRLHLAAVIVSLQVLGQVAFEFRLSIAQILVSLLTCAVLEVGIAFRRQRVIMWPASALLTGNGVAFILRVPGTEHGHWWSLRGAWIFAATAAVSILSKHVIKLRGGHVFNPSNIGLVLCFLVLGSGRADPLDFWWAPMSAWMALALAIIVAGGFAILSRLRLLVVAVAFWLSFAAGIGVLAASGHAMTARWHLGPITGGYFWWVLVSSPEILVFLFFMITDPKTVPSGRGARIAYAVGVGLVAAILIAPQRTEFATKVAVLGALAIVCAARPLVERFRPAVRVRAGRLAFVGAAAVAAYAGLLVAAGIPARSSSAAEEAIGATRLPQITILPSHGVSSTLDRRTARRIAAGLVADLGPANRVDRVRVWLEGGDGQGPPLAVAVAAGKRFELELRRSRYVVVGGLGATSVSAERRRAAAAGFAGLRLTDVARQVGLNFRQGAFRFGVTNDSPAMMGGGVCWLDYDNDGWLDLFAVNSYADSQIPEWQARGGLPRSALFHNVHGRFVNVTARSGAGLTVRGSGCVAADLNADGYTDLYVTTAVDDKLLWNSGDGTFAEGARAAGVVSFGWHAGAAVADVDGDGRADLFVAGYTDVNAQIPSSDRGYPSNHQGVSDELFLNEGNGKNGRARFREVGRQVGLDAPPYDHSLGAVFSDLNGDGRPDLYVANDEDPNRLYLNEPGGPLGFHFVEAARREHVADANAGMGIAAGDYNRDGKPDLFVTNSRGQTHASFESRGGSFVDARSLFKAAFGRNFTGWGDSWVDLRNDGNLDLVVANGGIPVTNLAKNAGPVQVLAYDHGRYENVSAGLGLDRLARSNGRGVAAADYDNDGRMDVAINSIGGRLVLLHNTGPTGHWLEVGLRHFAPSTLVTAVLPDGRRLVREVQAGSSYLSSEDPRVHFGLGTTTKIRKLVARTPRGSTVLTNITANQIVAVSAP